MSKKIKKEKQLFTISLGSKKIAVTKPRLQWAILIVLVVSIVLAQVSGLYPYIYNYARCGDQPLEIRGGYFRIPYDENYGIHVGSDYSHCFDGLQTGLQRDPSTKAGAALIEHTNEWNDFGSGVDGYIVYVPNGYSISQLSKRGMGKGVEVNYSVTSNGVKFTVREMKKDSDFSYTNLCSQPPKGSWAGRVVGEDTAERQICRVDSSYVRDYVVGININNTAIMLETNLGKPEAELNAAATVLFSSMKPHSN